MRVKMSPLALYNYDNTIFDNFHIPSGITSSALIEMLLIETADLSTCFPNPDLFKSILDKWSSRKLPIWTRLYATTQLNYDPISNYDRTETKNLTIEHSGTVKNTGSVSDQGSDTGTVGNMETISNTGTVKNTGTVSDSGTDGGTVTDANTGYNSGTFQDVTRRTDNLTHGNTRTDDLTNTQNLTESHNGTETRNLSNSNTRTDNLTETRDLTDTHSETIRAYGNIGVTTSQQMIAQERDISTFDIMSVIIDDFIDYFCIGIY